MLFLTVESLIDLKMEDLNLLFFQQSYVFLSYNYETQFKTSSPIRFMITILKTIIRKNKPTGL